MNNYFVALAMCLTLGCTQGAAPTTDAASAPNATQNTAGVPPAVAAAATAPTTPPLSIVDDGLAAQAKGAWCLKDGTAPFTKIVINDMASVAPIEGQSVGKSTQKDTATQQAPGTGTATASNNNIFQIKWLRSGITGAATIKLDGEVLQFTDDASSDSGMFNRCE